MFHRRVLRTVQAPFVAAGGGAASGWGDHGSWIDITTTSVANDTMTSNDTTGFAAARGAVGHGTGKWYFEVKLLTPPGADAMHIGLCDTFTGAGGMNTHTFDHGIKHYGNNGVAVIDGAGFGLAAVDLGAAITTATNDVLAIAFDATNGFHYLAQNNTWFLGGVPTSGATGTGHVAAYTSTALGATVYPVCTAWKTVNCVLKLVTGAGALTYSPPSGYTAWG